MKLLTLNAHSHPWGREEEQGEKIAVFRDLCLRERPSVIALQEAGQSRHAPLCAESPEGMTPCGADIPLREDNFVLRVTESLRRAGLFYFWIWLPVKVGYGRFDEGLAFLSLAPIDRIRSLILSEPRPYEDWRRRMALLFCPEGCGDWFCNLHMSWWDDAEEPFVRQWERLLKGLPTTDRLWLMGDFNNPAEVRGEGYDRVLCSGFYDCYRLARRREGEETVRGIIDGWHGRSTGRDRFRIDQIWHSRSCPMALCRTVFDGVRGPVISDHFGVLIETEKRKKPATN